MTGFSTGFADKIATQGETMIVWLRQKILKCLYPVLSKAAKLHHQATMTSDFVDEVMSKIGMGDVLVTRIDGNLANKLIPGFYTHAAIYIGDNMVMESTGDGVRKKHIAKFLFDKDHVAVLRPKFANFNQIELACLTVEGLEGDPYDFDFTGENRAWYCSEIIWFGYDEAMKPESSPFTLRETWGVKTVVPQDFYQATAKFDLVTKFGTVE